KNLYLLPSGSITPNPSELLGSARMGYLLEILKNKFDMVILDSSPVAPTSDALLLAPQVDGVVVVIKAGGTARTLVRETVQQLEKTKANILGVLLNKSEMTDTYRNYYSYAHKN
ncbi:MAG: chromosome partitioning ATPase, partial [uncultured bacterium]